MALGSVLRTLSGRAYGFDDPCALALAGRYLWVADARAASVTEIDTASGTALRILSGARHGFDNPYALASSGNRIWVANAIADQASDSIHRTAPR